MESNAGPRPGHFSGARRTEKNPHRPVGTLAAIEIRSCVEALGRLGFDSKSILSEAGIEPERLTDPFGRLPTTCEHSFWGAAERISKDPAIGLRTGVEHFRHGARTLLEYVVTHSPTLRQALDAVRSMAPLVDDLGHLDVLEHAGLAHIGIRRDGIPRARGYVESVCAVAFSFYVGHVEGFRLSGIAFTNPRPGNVRPYVGLFGVVPEFSAEQDQLIFDQRYLDLTLAGADPNVGVLLREHAERLLRELPKEDPFLDGVRRAMAREFTRGQASPERVARATGTSMRTLRRRLSALNTSYQALLDELRRTTACYRLEHSNDSIDAVAEGIGFSSRTAFQRAFRRYTGLSPSEYRAARACRP